MTKFQAFRKFIQKNRHQLTVKGTPPVWPYNYGTRLAYIVTMGEVTQYFYFNDDGILLQRKRLT
jgi:hypothetical protein